MAEQKATSKQDPWADDPSMAGQGAVAAAPASDDDWKIWQQEGDAGSTSAPATDWLSKLIGQKTEPAIESALQPSMHSKGAGVFDNVMTGVGNVAKGAGHMLTHPDELVTGAIESSPPAVFVNSLRDAYKEYKGEPNATREKFEHPLENAEYSLGEAAPLMVAGGADALPSKSRANAVFADIGRKAANVPVSPTETVPAMDTFRNSVRTGGRNSVVARKLDTRLQSGQPMNFPEARQFYTNISRATARPGVFRRAIESPAMPDLRRNLGGVRSAFNEDITNSLGPLGESDRYTDALREYARAAKLGKVAKTAGTIALVEGLRHVPLGAFAGKVMGQ